MFTFAPPEPKVDICEELKIIYDMTEYFREKADYKTGSITFEAMKYLRNLCDEFKPTVVAEVGTFIGRSALTIISSESVEHIFTCDKDNDCVNATPQVHIFPRQKSTDMFQWLCRKNEYVDMFFFDGRILPQDIALILRLSSSRTIYVFDDYEGREKGVVNAELLSPYLKNYTLILGPPSDSDFSKKVTIVALVPKDMV